jgi:hypothetical protein
MNSIQIRFLYFLLGCMPARLLLVWVAKNYTNTSLERSLLSGASLVIGCSFLFLFITGYRSTGPEVMGDVIWWKPLRIVHAIMYLSFAYSLFYDIDLTFTTVGGSNSWLILLLDVMVGLVSFLYYHKINSNFLLL